MTEEDCDDGNNLDGDCCSHDCLFESSENPCDDGNGCTQTDTCDGDGACVGSNNVTCDPAGECQEPGVCFPGTGFCDYEFSTQGTACGELVGFVCDGSGNCVPSELE